MPDEKRRVNVFALERGMDDYRKGRPRAPTPADDADLFSDECLRWFGYGIAMFRIFRERKRVMDILGAVDDA